MEIAHMNNAARKFGRAAIGIAAMCGLQAAAQQQVPAPMKKLEPSAWKQTVPDIAAQQTPGSPSAPKPAMVPLATPPVAMAMPVWVSDDCGLSEVSAVELQAVRASILAALASNSAGVASFTTAEKQIPAACTRKRAAYYLRAIAQIQSAK